MWAKKLKGSLNREIYQQIKASRTGKEDIHTRLMRKYKDIPKWWFHVLLLASFLLALVLCIFMKDQIQMPWWGLIFAAGLALTFTLPVSIITATTNNVSNHYNSNLSLLCFTTWVYFNLSCISNCIKLKHSSRDVPLIIILFIFLSSLFPIHPQSPGLNIITEYIMGVIQPGKPIANVCFKTYGYISMAQAVSFLSDFKLGHYMKIPPRSMFIVQVHIFSHETSILIKWNLIMSNT